MPQLDIQGALRAGNPSSYYVSLSTESFSRTDDDGEVDYPIYITPHKSFAEAYCEG